MGDIGVLVGLGRQCVGIESGTILINRCLFEYLIIMLLYRTTCR